MKNPIKKILFSLFLIFSLAITAMSASAVTTYAEFTGESVIDEGESTTFDAVLYSMDPPTVYSIILYDEDMTELSTLESGTAATSLYESLDIVIDQSMYTSNGTYYIYLTATDARGDSDYSDLTLTVNAAPEPEPEEPETQYAPVVSIITPNDQDDFKIGYPINFAATASDADGTIASYSWASDIDGNIGNSQSFTTSSLSLEYHKITVTVTDNDGLTASDSIDITVKALEAPTAVITSPTIGSVFDPGEIIIFDGSQSYDEDGYITSWSWHSYNEDGSDKDGALGDLAAISRDDLSLGRHYITLTVIDNDVLQYVDTFTVWIIISPLTAPDVNIDSPVNGAVFESDEQINFSATVSDNGNIVSYEWTSDIYGEIDSGSGEPSSFTTTLPIGEHEITLTATDNSSLTGQDTVWITIVQSITPAPEPEPESEEEIIQNSLFIKSISIPSGEIVSTGDTVDFSIRFKNEGEEDLKDIKATAVIQELGIMDKVGPFDLKENKERTETLSLEIPDYAEDGEYVVRLVISNNDVHRIVYRFIVVR